MILASMIAAYIVDPVGIKKAKENDKGGSDPSDKAFETLLMALLFIYLTISVNSESTFSSESSDRISSMAINCNVDDSDGTPCYHAVDLE